MAGCITLLPPLRSEQIKLSLVYKNIPSFLPYAILIQYLIKSNVGIIINYPKRRIICCLKHEYTIDKRSKA
jgi:hypothetical protein